MKQNGTQASSLTALKGERLRTGRTGNCRYTVAYITRPSQTGEPNRNGSASGRSTNSWTSWNSAKHSSVYLSRKHFMNKLPSAKDRSAPMEKRLANFYRPGSHNRKGNRRRTTLAQRNEEEKRKSFETHGMGQQPGPRLTNDCVKRTIKKSETLDPKA